MPSHACFVPASACLQQRQFSSSSTHPTECSLRAPGGELRHPSQQLPHAAAGCSPCQCQLRVTAFKPLPPVLLLPPLLLLLQVHHASDCGVPDPGDRAVPGSHVCRQHVEHLAGGAGLVRLPACPPAGDVALCRAVGRQHACAGWAEGHPQTLPPPCAGPAWCRKQRRWALTRDAAVMLALEASTPWPAACLPACSFGRCQYVPAAPAAFPGSAAAAACTGSEACVPALSLLRRPAYKLPPSPPSFNPPCRFPASPAG